MIMMPLYLKFVKITSLFGGNLSDFFKIRRDLMGKGKRTTTSSRAFTPIGNKNVKNTVFYSEPTEELHKMPAIDSVENDLSPIDYKKKVIAKSKHIRNYQEDVLVRAIFLFVFAETSLPLRK